MIMAQDTTAKEITMLDIVDILVRYRKLIIIPTLLSIILLLAIAFVTQRPISTFIFERGSSAILSLQELTPGALRSELFFDPLTEITHYVESANFFRTAVREFIRQYPQANLLSEVDLSVDDELYSLHNDLSLKWDSAMREITLHHPFLFSERPKDFWEAYIEQLRIVMRDDLQKRYDVYAQSVFLILERVTTISLTDYSLSISTNNSSGQAISIDSISLDQIIDVIQEQELTKRFLVARQGQFWFADPKIIDHMAPNNISYVTVLLETVVGGLLVLFLFILLAFFFNFVHSVRRTWHKRGGIADDTT